jgi:hypothetical protein
MNHYLWERVSYVDDCKAGCCHGQYSQENNQPYLCRLSAYLLTKNPRDYPSLFVYDC